MLTPLNQFICDTCGEIINEPKEGWIEWISDIDEKNGKFIDHSFRIVHHFAHSPLAETKPDGCYQHQHALGRSDSHLHQFISDEYKMAHILKFLDIGPYHQPNYKGPSVRDMREYVEVMRRLTIPYYEEARQYWNEAQSDGYFADANEIWVYGASNLQTLIEQYS
jgi:hypothetical protein